MARRPLFEGSLVVRKPISHALFDAATAVWKTSRTVTVEKLTETTRSLGVKATPEQIEDMVRVSEFLNTICP